MLLKDFYLLRNLIQVSGDEYEGEITLRSQHDVFKGHFPGNPVTPGVCQLQIVKEILTGILKKDLLLKRAREIKFLKVIVPDDKAVLKVSITINGSQSGLVSIKASILESDEICFKVKAEYSLINQEITESLL